MAVRQFIKSIKASTDNKEDDQDSSDDSDEEVHCLDDEVLNLEKDRETLEDQKRKLDFIRQFNYGEYFGGVDLGENYTISEDFYITDSGCQFGIITQSVSWEMRYK